MPPTQMPLRLEAAILSRMRSPVTSRSNWAKDSSTLRVSRPMLVVVLKLWVTDTKDTPCCVEQLDQLGEVGQRAGQAVDLVDHHHIDAAVADVGQELLQGRAFQRSAREAAIVVAVAQRAPAFMGLALDIGLGGLALVVEGVELLVEAMLGRDPGVDGAAQRFCGDRLHGSTPTAEAGCRPHRGARHDRVADRRRELRAIGRVLSRSTLLGFSLPCAVAGHYPADRGRRSAGRSTWCR